jgi:hypothetical protein
LHIRVLKLLPLVLTDPPPLALVGEAGQTKGQILMMPSVILWELLGRGRAFEPCKHWSHHFPLTHHKLVGHYVKTSFNARRNGLGGTWT